jgi:hypothetical protein
MAGSRNGPAHLVKTRGERRGGGGQNHRGYTRVLTWLAKGGPIGDAIYKQHKLVTSGFADEQILTEQPKRLALSSFHHTVNRDPRRSRRRTGSVI